MLNKYDYFASPGVPFDAPEQRGVNFAA